MKIKLLKITPMHEQYKGATKKKNTKTIIKNYLLK